MSPSTTIPTQATDSTSAVSSSDLEETFWSGVDSGLLETAFTFHGGGTVTVAYNGNSYDFPGDTWELDGSTLTITIYNVEGVGDTTYIGDVTDAAGPIDLGLTFTDVTETRTLTITKG